MKIVGIRRETQRLRSRQIIVGKQAFIFKI